MGPNRFESQTFSLFIVKFKKLEFNAPLILYKYLKIKIDKGSPNPKIYGDLNNRTQSYFQW